MNSGALYNLINLRKLTLINVKLMSDKTWDAYEYAFEDLIYLEFLKFEAEQQFSKFPFKLDHLYNLKWLQLRGFYIDQHLIEKFKKNQQISILRFKNCLITESIFINIPSLRGFEIFRNKLDCYKIEFGTEMKNLEYLRVKLDYGVDISKSTHLRYLDLEENNFDLTNGIFKELKNLEELKVRIKQEKEFSSLKRLNDQHFYLPKLTRLILNC